ncbi:MAG TPA: hypothetical protein VF876_06670 [Burkholderiales bacterium]
MSLAVLPAAAAMALYGAWVSGSSDVAEQRPARIPYKASAAWRCAHCGRIESKRKRGPEASDPLAAPTYEYTVRMANGSGREFREQSPVSWRVGERLIYIDGMQSPPPAVASGAEH